MILQGVPNLFRMHDPHWGFMVPSNVNIAYESMSGHVFGFLMLQLVLIAVAHA